MNLGKGLINEIQAMGGSDVWLMLRQNAIGVCYNRGGKLVRHSVALPFGNPSDEVLAVLLDMADEDFRDNDRSVNVPAAEAIGR